MTFPVTSTFTCAVADVHASANIKLAAARLKAQPK
jgi:hypothetical protein